MANCKIVGETTFGATGPLVENAVYNDGSFNVSPYITVETSSSEFKYIDGKIYEGKGFAPDFPVSFDRAAINSGIDSQMNKAIMLAK
jgi:C-terminal processing protease CtpA/Prc